METECKETLETTKPGANDICPWLCGLVIGLIEISHR